VLYPGYFSSPHHRLPPSGERVSGEVPQAAKGCPAGEAGQPGLALPPPLGHAGTQVSPKGGLRPRPRWCMERPSPCLGSFWRPLHRPETASFSCYARGCPASSLRLRGRLRPSRSPSRRLPSTRRTSSTSRRGPWPLLSHLSTRGLTGSSLGGRRPSR
jgi:hypothetical protein